MRLRVKRLDSADVIRWDEFVENCPTATFFHLSGWKQAVEGVFGYSTQYLYAEEGGAIQGVLPLALIRSWIFGSALISVPFCVYGGIAARTEEAYGALQAEGARLAEGLGVDYLELRNRDLLSGKYPSKDLYVTFRRSISSVVEENMKAIPRKQRAMVRKGIQAGLRSELDGNVDRFFAIYSVSVRNLGTPVLPRKWFETIMKIFSGRCEVLTITLDGRPLSSVMSYYFRDEVLPYYGGGTLEARRHRANDFMYWELMRRAGSRGVSEFDFGRSKVGTGPYNFKKNWGFAPKPLHYEYFLVKAKQVPHISPMNPKYRIFVKMWRYMPLSLSRVVGPLLSRYLA